LAVARRKVENDFRNWYSYLSSTCFGEIAMQNYLISICLTQMQKYKNISIPDMQLFFVLFPSDIHERRKMSSTVYTAIIGLMQENNPYSGFH